MKERLCGVVWVTCGLTAAGTSWYMLRAHHDAPLWDQWYLVVAWALSPFALLAAVTRGVRRNTASLVCVCWGAGGAAAVGLVYMCVLPQSAGGTFMGGEQASLYLMIFPLLQLAVAGLACLTAGAFWLAGRAARRPGGPRAGARGFPVLPLGGPPPD